MRAHHAGQLELVAGLELTDQRFQLGSGDGAIAQVQLGLGPGDQRGGRLELLLELLAHGAPLLVVGHDEQNALAHALDAHFTQRSTPSVFSVVAPEWRQIGEAHFIIPGNSPSSRAWLLMY
ncbi:hypothetical protein D3C72_1962230 [compost metagenome]